MSDCCRPATKTDCCAAPADEATARPDCRSCGQKGKTAQCLTPQSLLMPDAAAQLRETTYRFCATPVCSVVYFSNETDQYFHKQNVRVRVGLKETTDPIPICYCFGYTVRDVEEEIEAIGRTTIPDRIEAEIHAGTCRCATENPQGVCCLGQVRRTVKKITAGAKIPAV